MMPALHPLLTHNNNHDNVCTYNPGSGVGVCLNKKGPAYRGEYESGLADDVSSQKNNNDHANSIDGTSVAIDHKRVLTTMRAPTQTIIALLGEWVLMTVVPLIVPPPLRTMTPSKIHLMLM